MLKGCGQAYLIIPYLSKIMNIAYSCNDNYIEQTGISIISLLENNKDIKDITIYLISKDISKDNIEKLRSICFSYNRNIIVIKFEDIAYDLKLTSTGRHIETIYTKIFFGRIDNLDNILYLDSDTIINGSLKDLFNIDLSDSYMGMVKTYTGSKAKKQLCIKFSSPFFNDGVALVNVDYCRKNHLIDKCLCVINEFDGNPPVLSEGVLNKVCEGHIKSISPKYNMMAGLYQLIGLDPSYVSEKLNYSVQDVINSFNHPIVIHFLSGFYNRPWNIDCKHPLQKEYFKYKDISPWKDTPMKNSRLAFKLKILGKILNIVGPNNFEKLLKILNK